MSAQEFAKCDFCGEDKPVSRQYARVKNKHFDDNKKGRYSNYFKYCADCGIEVSDGYHTFDELYDHRIALYIALCGFACLPTEFNHYIPQYEVWRSRLHSDGSSYDGWFLLGINKERGEQITYHIPLSYWDKTSFAETLDKAPEFDGHTPKDVVQRLTDM